MRSLDTIAHMTTVLALIVSMDLRYHFGDPHNKDYNILGSIWGYLILGNYHLCRECSAKLPLSWQGSVEEDLRTPCSVQDFLQFRAFRGLRVQVLRVWGCGLMDM